MYEPYGNENNDWWKSYDREIAKVFKKFAGKQVNPADAKDPILEAMRLEAATYYSYLRLISAGSEPPRDPAEFSRINVDLVEQSDGKWAIGNRFFRG